MKKFFKNQKDVLNFALTALLTVVVSLGIVACKDDDNDTKRPDNTEQAINNKPADSTPEDVNIHEALLQLQNDTNGDEDSLYFFIEEAKQQGNFLTDNYMTCRYNYLSTTADGQPVWLTGRMAWPVDGEAEYILGGCHITMTDNIACPSVSTSMTSDCGISCLLFARKALVVFPDYEGYGSTINRPHPYLYQEATARQVVDGILAARKQFLEQRGGRLSSDYKTVIVGYSQGGSVAMATHRYLEQGFGNEAPLADELRLAGSVCGDGPYDPVSTLKQYIASNRLYMPVVVPLIIKGMCDSNPYVAGHYGISDYLCADFLNSGIAEWIGSKGVSTDDIQQRLCDYSANHDKGIRKYDVSDGDSLFLMYGFARKSTGWVSTEDIGFLPITADNDKNYIWRGHKGDRYATTGSVLRPEVRAYFNQAGETSSVTGSLAMTAIHQALEMNNLTKGWQPQHPMIVFHSKYDEVVPYVNYEQARLAFTSPNFHGITYDTNVQTHISVGESFFTLYLSGFVSALRDGTAASWPHERTQGGMF